MNDYTERYVALFSELSAQQGFYITAVAIRPLRTANRMNTAYLFSPEACVHPGQDSI
jgi:hypothetical protein